MFGLSDEVVDAIRAVLARHSAVTAAIVFGSRALGREQNRSDIDICLRGNLDPLEVERIALDLEELPLPIHFDVQAENAIRNPALREHLARAGRDIYRRSPGA